MGLQVITEKLNQLLGSSSLEVGYVEINYEDIQIPSFEIITDKGRMRFSIEKCKLLSEASDSQIMNIIPQFYKFSKNTLIREWNQYRPPSGTYAIEQIKFDLDIPTTKTLILAQANEGNSNDVYQIRYLFTEDRQTIHLYFTLIRCNAGTSETILITYRTIIFLLANLGPVSDSTVRLIIKKLHSEILMDAVFFAITSNEVRLDLVLIKKFVNDHKPELIKSDDIDINEFLPVHDRPYTTKRGVVLRK